MAKMHDSLALTAQLCNGCGACLKACPTDVFGFDEKTDTAFIAFPLDCHVCFLCQDDCPTGAITVGYDRSSPRRYSIYDAMQIDISSGYPGDAHLK
jgi:NAD-dependent dihydropyrimidine dehydrogenase PreA subunit